METAENKLRSIMKTLGLPVRGSYRAMEVCMILGICRQTFWNLCDRFERADDNGTPRNPSSLDSFLIRRERRVTHDELIRFFQRNSTYDRQNNV